jgi:hypothetical protein
MDLDPKNEETRNWLVLAVAIALVVLTVSLLLKLKSGIAMENCVAQGRHDCAPISTDPPP